MSKTLTFWTVAIYQSDCRLVERLLGPFTAEAAVEVCAAYNRITKDTGRKAVPERCDVPAEMLAKV